MMVCTGNASFLKVINILTLKLQFLTTVYTKSKQIALYIILIAIYGDFFKR